MDDVQGLAAAELLDHVALGLGDDDGLSDGPAALADDDVDLHGPGNRDADGPGAKALVAKDQRVVSRLACAGRHAADDGDRVLRSTASGDGRQQPGDRRRERVGEHDDRAQIVGDAQVLAHHRGISEARSVLLGVEPPGVQPCPRHAEGQGRHPGTALQLTVHAQHALGGDSKHRAGHDRLADRVSRLGKGGRVVKAPEEDGQVAPAAKLVEEVAGDLRRCGPGVEMTADVRGGYGRRGPGWC